MRPCTRVAPFGRRVAAGFIDGMILLVPYGVASAVVGRAMGGWAWVLPGAVYGVLTDDLARGVHDDLAGTRLIDVR